MVRAVRTLMVFLVCTLISGCVLVEDDNGWWAKGKIDQALVGKWLSADNPNTGGELRVNQNNQQLDFYPAEFDPNYNYKRPVILPVKTVKLGKSSFFISKNELGNGKTGYFLIAYQLKGDTLKVFMPDWTNTELVEKVFNQNKKENVVNAMGMGMMVSHLDDGAIEKMNLLFSKPNYFERKVLKKVKEWPQAVLDKRKETMKKEPEEEKEYFDLKAKQEKTLSDFKSIKEERYAYYKEKFKKPQKIVSLAEAGDLVLDDGTFVQPKVDVYREEYVDGKFVNVFVKTAKDIGLVGKEVTLEIPEIEEFAYCCRGDSSALNSSQKIEDRVLATIYLDGTNVNVYYKKNSKK